jgi:hypothetical protein
MRLLQHVYATFSFQGTFGVYKYAVSITVCCQHKCILHIFFVYLVLSQGGCDVEHVSMRTA